MRKLIVLLPIALLFMFHSTNASQRLCRNLMDPQRPFRGSMPGFNFNITPKFTLVELEKNRHRLQPGQSEYLLGESGNFRLMVEERMIPNHLTPQIVVVKYSKHQFENDALPEEKLRSETFTVARKMHELKSMLEKEGLEDFYDVILPIEVTENYIVLPFVEGKSFDDLTDQHFAERGIKKNPKSFADILGPPSEGVSPLLNFLWRHQLHRLEAIFEHLKSRKFKFESSSVRKSPDGVKFRDHFIVSHPDYTYELRTPFNIRQVRTNFTFRHDIIISTDGRLVITDPY